MSTPRPEISTGQLEQQLAAANRQVVTEMSALARHIDELLAHGGSGAAQRALLALKAAIETLLSRMEELQNDLGQRRTESTMATKQNILQQLLGAAVAGQPLASPAPEPAAQDPGVVPAAVSPPGAGGAAKTAPPAAALAAAQPVDMNALMEAMINANLTLIDRFVTLLEKLQADVMSAPQGTLNGEKEELLRLLIQVAQQSIEALLALHERLQTAIIESYFQAQV